MAKNVVPFSKARSRRRGRGTRGGARRVPQLSWLWLLIFAALYAVVWYATQGEQNPFVLPKIGERAPIARSFALCGAIRRDDCVIDGDTFKYGGQSIRIADIDAPETHPPRCEYEAQLGARATHRLRELLNEGPFVLRRTERDEDRYGRKLRIVTRNGRSLGAVLVDEELARPWAGRRQRWC